MFKLVEQQDIQLVYRQGKRLSTPYFILAFHRNTVDNPRLCISVGRKHIARAVDRNRIKRIIRESFRQHRATLKNIDIIIIINKRVLTLDKKALRQWIDQQWQKL